MANYEVLEPGGHAALVDGLKDYADRAGGTDTEQLADGSVNLDKLDEDVLDVLDTKADIDGYYAQLTAGAADNLTGRGDTATASFLYRTAGGTADIETGQAVAKSVKGNTLVWNQLAPSATVTASPGWRHLDAAYAAGTVQDGKIVVTSATDTSTPKIVAAYKGNSFVTFPANHVYYLSCDIDASGVTTEGLVSSFVLYNATSNASIVTVRSDGSSNAAIGTTTTETRLACRLASATPNGEYSLFSNMQCIDLTKMFGAGNEPSTVAEFEALFPLPYYEYDAGSLLSVNMEGIETVGFNLWDEEWELGGYDITSGAKTAHPSRIRSKDFIPCFPSTDYYAKYADATGNGADLFLMGYDADKNYIGQVSRKSSATNFSVKNQVVTTPSNCCYMTLMVGSNSTPVTTYKNDICINLSWSGRRNGEYEQYWSSQREIAASTYFPDGMRSAGTVRDELTSTEAITRVGVLDSTSSWFAPSPSTANEHGIAYVQIKVGSTAGSMALNASKIVANIPIGTGLFADATRREFAFNGQDIFYRYPTSSPSLSAALADMQENGAVCFYQLETPTVTPIDPALNLSYRVDDFGTERIMVPQDERSAPPVLDIAYGLNVVDFVRRAPSEYMSHASMSQFRLALMSHFGIFINETWDEVDNRYEYTITSE